MKSRGGSNGWGWKGSHELALMKPIFQDGRKKKELVSCRNSRVEGRREDAILNKTSDK